MEADRSRRNEPEPVGPIRSRRRGTNGTAAQGIENPGRLRHRRPLSLPIERSITDVARETERCSKDKPSSGSARRPGGAFADILWQRSLSMARTTAWQRKKRSPSSWPPNRNRLTCDDGCPDDRDVRTDPQIATEILTFLDAAGVKTVALADRIIGCSHEEGIDYEGPTCSRCP